MMKNALCNSRHSRTCRRTALINVTLESVSAARDIMLWRRGSVRMEVLATAR